MDDRGITVSAQGLMEAFGAVLAFLLAGPIVVLLIILGWNLWTTYTVNWWLVWHVTKVLLVMLPTMIGLTWLWDKNPKVTIGKKKAKVPKAMAREIE